MNKVSALVLSLALLAGGVPARAANPYWGYQYKQISVTAQGEGEYASNLAHNLYRLDLSIAAVLQANNASAWRPPTAVYAVPADLFMEFTALKADSASIGSANPFSSRILINTSVKSANRYWQVYFAYASSVLGASYSFRYPQWFITGLCEVFAASTVERTHVTIGGASPGRVYTLFRGSWIPVRTLLATQWNDPQLSAREFADMYYAETWYLVHKIVIDQFYHTNFHEYFNRLDRGDTEDSAFAASFDLSADELDKALKKTITSGKFQQLKVTIADVDDGTKPVRLTEAQAKARLALYAAEHGVQPQTALRLSAEALKLDPGSEDARAAKVHAELRASDADAALRDANELCGSNANSAQTLSTCGFAYASLGRRKSDKAVTGMSQADLNAKALTFYEREVQKDADDLQAWYSLASVTCETGNVENAKALLGKILVAQTAHPHVGTLAGSVARLYALTDDSDNAMKYALLWQANSLSSAERAAALAYIGHLKDSNARKQAAGASPASGAK